MINFFTSTKPGINFADFLVAPVFTPLPCRYKANNIILYKTHRVTLSEKVPLNADFWLL